MDFLETDILLKDQHLFSLFVLTQQFRVQMLPMPGQIFTHRPHVVFTSRSINIYSWAKCKLLRFSPASNNGVRPTQIGQLLCAPLYQASSVQSSREHNSIHYSFHHCAPLKTPENSNWRLWYERHDKNTQADFVDSFPGRQELKSWRNYRLTSFNHMRLALYWPH